MSTHCEHHVDDRIEHQVDLRFAVAAALRREDHGAHVIDGDGPSVAEVPRELVGEPIHLPHPVAERQRADPVEALALGYRVRDVDRFADKLTRYFRDGWPISIDDVRTVVFTTQRGGYRESQVDLVLDAVVDVMLAVR